MTLRVPSLYFAEHSRKRVSLKENLQLRRGRPRVQSETPGRLHLWQQVQHRGRRLRPPVPVSGPQATRGKI